MAIPSFSSTVVARAAAALYGVQLGNGSMASVLEEANATGGVEKLINSVYNRDYGAVSNADVASMVVANLGITGAGVANAVAYLKAKIDAAGPANEGAAIAAEVANFASLTGDATYGAAATAFNGRISAAVSYAQQGGTADRAFGAGATIAATVGQDFLTGTSGNDSIVARIFDNQNTLQSGDWIDGGAGADRLDADMGSSPNFSPTPETVGIETVAFRAQAKDPSDSSDNNLDGPGRVIIDAQRMSGVTRWDSFESRADLIIEDVRTPLRTKDITIGMIGTDAGNVDYAVYFDKLRADGSSTATLGIELMDTRAATSADPALRALPLKNSPFNGFSFKVNGKTITLKDPVGSDPLDTTTFNGSQTYEQLELAIQKLLTLPANLAAFPELAGITAKIDGTFDARDTITGELATGKRIVLTGSSAAGLTLATGNFIADEGVDPSSGLHTVQTTASSSSTDLITSTIVLDNVGRGSNGGDLVIGAMSTGQTSGSAGVARFEITVEQTSNLGVLSSTNDALKEVVVVSGAAKGSLSVKGNDNNTSLVAGALKGDNNNVLPGATHTAFGFSDVRLIDMKGMAASVSYDAQITGGSFSKYVQVSDTQPDPAGDNTSTVGKTTLQVADFKYSGGSANDTIAVVIDQGIAASQSTVIAGREDATFLVEGMDGNDSISVRIGNPLTPGATTLAQTGNDGLINATGLVEPWYEHQKANANVTIDAGAGNDTVRTPGAGDAKILLGTGDDTVYVDNTGFQVSTNTIVTNSGRAIWVFNTNDQALLDGAPASRNVDDIKSDLTNDTHQLYRAKVTVTFFGLTASVDLPTGVYTPTDLHINQAIKKAINEDPVLRKLLVAEDGPLYSLMVKSLIDGVMVDADLGVAVTIVDVATLSASERATLKTEWTLADDLPATITAAMTAAATAFNTVETDYDGKFGASPAGVELVGANSTTPSDNTITPGAGNDVMVLGTTSAAAAPESSNDTVVYTNALFDKDTIVNFQVGVAATGGDKLNFIALGGKVTGVGAQLTNTATGTPLPATHRTVDLQIESTAIDTTTEIAALYTDAGAVITTAVTHVFVAISPTDASVAKIYRIDDPVGATANVTATLMGTIDLADVTWASLTADNFS